MQQPVRHSAMPAAPQASPAALSAARGIAKVLDGWRLDPIMGMFLPAIGDVLGGALGLVIVGIAVQQRVPKPTVARMLLNIAFDTLLGSIPIVGDILDFWFPAHTYNVRLLERATATRRSRWSDYLILGVAALACLAALVLPLVALWWLVAHAFGGTPSINASKA